MTRLRVLAVRVGSERHGVNRYGRDLAAALRTIGGADVADAAEVDPRRAGPALRRLEREVRPHVVHLHLTEQLFGPDPDQAAAALEHLAAAVASPLVATLHDVPADRSAGQERRWRFFSTALARCARVVVSSDHERARLGSTPVPVDVVPLLVRRLPRPLAVERGDAVAVLGYLYPGKGHEDVLEACALLARDGVAPPLVALGTAAPRHPELTAALMARGRDRGVAVTVTGWVDDVALPLHLARAGCPVVPNHTVSASASLATWVGAGRRPLVAAGPYAREFADRAPGCVRLYQADAGPEALAAAIAGARRDPAATRLASLPRSLSPAAVAAAHLALYQEVAR